VWLPGARFNPAGTGERAQGPPPPGLVGGI